MGIRTWMLRRAMGRLRITDDIVRYVSTFQHWSSIEPQGEADLIAGALPRTGRRSS